jgi:plasmid stabilization system protein ParE
VKLVILPQALGELQQAAAFYIEHANVALGESFAVEFERSISALLEHPLIGNAWRGGTRQFPLCRFPYSIVYQIKPDLLRVVAVAHHSRRPGYWSRRR